MDNDSRREQRIQALIEKSQGPLKKAVQTATDLKAITTLLQRLLDPELATHCRASEWNNNCLTLAADNAAWATRLRYQQSAILSQLRAEPQFAGLGSIRIELQAPEELIPTIAASPATPAAAKRRIVLSATAAADIKATADKIEDPALKAALEKLAERGK